MKTLKQYILEDFKISKSTIRDGRKPDDANEFKVGDIIVTIYSYNDTCIPEFFKITRRTKSTIWFIELEHKYVKGSMTYGECVAGENQVKDGTEMQARVRNGELKINKRYAYLWDGEPMRISYL